MAKKTDERIPTASNIATNHDMIKMSPKGMKAAINVTDTVGRGIGAPLASFLAPVSTVVSSVSLIRHGIRP
jgi:hypothetical protein